MFARGTVILDGGACGGASDRTDEHEGTRGEYQSTQAMAQEESAELKATISELENRITVLLLPTDPLDERNIMLEVRAGTGGDEAGIWCGDLQRMYTRFAESEGWKVRASPPGATGQALGCFKGFTAGSCVGDAYGRPNVLLYALYLSLRPLSYEFCPTMNLDV